MFESRPRGRISPWTLGAGLMVAAGFFLAGLDGGFLVLVGVGAFGPGILRELGWIQDKDELQIQADRRAGYHAFLAGGFVAFLLVGWAKGAEPPLAHSAEMVADVLVVMGFVWLFSSLFGYWGAQKTTLRILVIFGLVWLLFNILSNTGRGYQGVLALIIQCSLAVPFFALAWLAQAKPRLAGLILTGCAAFFFFFFHLSGIFGPDPLAKGRIPVLVLFVGPLLACGLMLLINQKETTASGEVKP